RVNGGRALEYEEILGYHLEQAHRYLAELGPLDDHGRELGADGSRRLASAGHRARARGDVAAAANLLERAAAILPELDPARLALLPELGEALIDIGRFPEAETVLAEAIDAARSTGDRQLEADVGLRRLLLELRSGEVDRWSEEAVPQIAAAIDVFTKASDHAGLARAYRLLGYVHGTACNYAEAAEACERALQHAAEAGNSREQRVNATSYALALCWGPTQVDEAIERTSQILEQVSGNRLSRGWVLCLLAHLRSMKGEFEGARELYRAGLAAMEEMGVGWYVAWTSLSAGRVEMRAGDYPAADRELRRGCRAPGPGRPPIALADRLSSHEGRSARGSRRGLRGPRRPLGLVGSRRGDQAGRAEGQHRRCGSPSSCSGPAAERSRPRANCC